MATTIAILFVVATTLQVALWARELILGVIEHRAGGARGEQRPRQRDRHHPAAGDHRHLHHRHRRRARQSRRQRHRPGRRPRHRRHRHRPRRQGHFRRPVRGAVDHLRQAVPPRRFDPLGHDLGHGRADRPQIDPGALDHRRGGGDLQHQPARARSCTIWRGSTGGGSSSRSASSTRPRPRSARASREIVKEVVAAATNACSCAAAWPASAPRASISTLEFDVKSEVWQKVFDARHQVLIAMLERFNDGRASSSPIRPRPASPRRRTAR